MKDDESYYFLYRLDEWLKIWFPRIWNALPTWTISAFAMWMYFRLGTGRLGFIFRSSLHSSYPVGYFRSVRRYGNGIQDPS